MHEKISIAPIGEKMTEIMIIGDVHGKWDDYARLLEMNMPERSIQIGDFGLGFPRQEESTRIVESAMETHGRDNKFFRGNHDNPVACWASRFCMDDVHVEEDIGLMSVAGAFSIDFAHRTEGVSWWREEELSIAKFNEALDLYEKTKPKIMLSHDGPEEVIAAMFPWYVRDTPYGKNRTRHALEEMRRIHKPEVWAFGHWHESIEIVMDGTRFVCLAELETMMLSV